MVDLDIAALAENLKDMAANLQTFIDVQAEAIAEPRILAAQLEAKAACDEQHRQAAADAQRLADLQAEIARHRKVWERNADRLDAEVSQMRAAVRRVEALHVWTNEDRRQFVFADELWAALAESGSPATRALADLRRKQEAARAATISEGN